MQEGWKEYPKREGEREREKESVETHILPTPTTSTTSWLHLLPPTEGELYVKSTWTFGSKKDGRIHSFPRIFPGKDRHVLSSMSPRNRWNPAPVPFQNRSIVRFAAMIRTRAWNNFSGKFEIQLDVEGIFLKTKETSYLVTIR